jgi:hypothetical protein
MCQCHNNEYLTVKVNNKYKHLKEGLVQVRGGKRKKEGRKKERNWFAFS